MTLINSNWFNKILNLARRFRQKRREARYSANAQLFRSICRRIPLVFEKPFFVKVGANDGITGDPCSDILLADERWKGLLLEPVPYCFDRLRKNFSSLDRFRLEQVAIGPSRSKESFYYIAAEAKDAILSLPIWYDQIGSFDRQHLYKHFGNEIEPFIVSLAVEVLPLDDLFNRTSISHCHLLHIDTEGYDFKVIGTLDLRIIRPTVIYIEHRHLSPNEKQSLVRVLKDFRYRLWDCGGDYMAIDTRFSRQLLSRQ
jgi:FkbM family methyltransferase